MLCTRFLGHQDVHPGAGLLKLLQKDHLPPCELTPHVQPAEVDARSDRSTGVVSTVPGDAPGSTLAGRTREPPDLASGSVVDRKLRRGAGGRLEPYGGLPEERIGRRPQEHRFSGSFLPILDPRRIARERRH